MWGRGGVCECARARVHSCHENRLSLPWFFHALTTAILSSLAVLRLPKVPNNAARLVLRVPKSDHISSHLASLYWLRINVCARASLF